MTEQNLRDLVKRAFWSKDVVLWIGSDTALEQTLADMRTKALDLLDLFSPTEDMPSNDRELGDSIRSRLDRHLEEMREATDGRAILIVRNTPILSRYEVGLRSFFDWFAGSTRMVVLTIPGELEPPHLASHLASDIKLDGSAIVNYLISCGVDPAKVYREK